MIYLSVGTISAFLALYALVGLLLTMLPSPLEEWPLNSGLTLVLFLAFCFLPAFFTAWLVTRAVRVFYRAGIFLGVILPAICWLVVVFPLVYLLKVTTPVRMSSEEREALRRVYVLSDLEAQHFQHAGTWQGNFSELTNIQPDFEEFGSLEFLMFREREEAKSYRETMEGYRFSILLYKGGFECVVLSVPVRYGEETKLSFALPCARFPLVHPLALADDANGGNATFLDSRFVFATGGWHLGLPGF